MEKAAEFAGKIRSVHAGKKLVYNLSPSFNWMGHGFTEESLKSFIWDLTEHGLVQSLKFHKLKDAQTYTFQVRATIDIARWNSLHCHDYK